jgi:hypothetical protein
MKTMTNMTRQEEVSGDLMREAGVEENGLKPSRQMGG